MPRGADRGRWAIEVATLGDGAVRIDTTGLMEAYERAARRWSRSRLAGAILGTLVVSGSLIVGVMALRWDVQHQRDVKALKFFVQEAETRVMCWRAVALRWNPTREDTAAVDPREAWVRKCVERELARQDGVLLRRTRGRTAMELEKIKQNHAAQGNYGAE